MIADVLFVDDPAARPRRLAITFDEHDDIAALKVGLRAFARNLDHLSVNGRPVDDAETLVGVGVVPGTILSARRPAVSEDPNPVGPRVQIIGGLDAGRTVPLQAHQCIGRGSSADISLPDPLVSRTHLEIHLEDPNTVRLVDRGGKNGTYVEGELLHGERVVSLPAKVLIGSTLLELTDTPVEHLPTETRPGAVTVRRRFRRANPDFPRVVEFPPEPLESHPPGILSNLALSVLPAGVLVAIGLLTGNTSILVFAAISPILGVARAFTQWRSYRRSQRDGEAGYRSELRAAEARLAAARMAERQAADAALPDLAALALEAAGPGRRLWERGAADPDALGLRVGTASLPSSIRLQSKDGRIPDAWHLPVLSDLRVVGNLSVAGESELGVRVVDGLILQLAVRNAPTEMKIMVIDHSGDGEFDWVTWLPHNRWSPDESFRLVGADRASTDARLLELRTLIAQRREQVRDRSDALPLPYVVVVLRDASSALAGGFGDVLAEGPTHGIHAICLDRTQVPEQCRASVVLGTGLDDAIYDQHQAQVVRDLLIEAPGAEQCVRTARHLAAYRSELDPGGMVELPGSLRLTDLLSIDCDPAAVLAGWQRTSPTAEAIVGIGRDGPVAISFTTQGPHGLVAGTTRAGKSEFIKTLTASLCMANHPDDLQLLFIDFKGGGDYQIARVLPHTVALATNESVSDLEDFIRTTRLLESEINRRKRVFKDCAQVNTIEAYTTARSRNRSLEPIGRLVVIVDEFAELAASAPEQLERLVSVARTGAAYGVHLLLATQRPGGVITSQIQANVNLRVCFRVLGKDESTDVISAPDAADIRERHRGRGFVRTGGAPLTEFQCARVGGARAGSAVERAPLTVELVLFSECGRLPPGAGLTPEVPDPETDFWDVAEAIHAAADASGWTHNCVPWPAPLPASVPLTELPPTADPALVPFVLFDDPDEQCRTSGGLTLGAGHLALAGSAQTGKTTALLSLATSAVLARSAAELHLFVIDFGGGGLRPLTALPHCAASSFDDLDQVVRILSELERLVADRLDAGARGIVDPSGGTDGPGAPRLLLLIDGWDALSEDGARLGLVDRVPALLQKGQAAGLQAVVTGDRTVLAGRFGRQIEHRLALRFNDPNDYTSFGLSLRDLPGSMPPGRCLDGDGRIGQVVTTRSDHDAFDALADELHRRDDGVRTAWPRRIEPLPRSISLADAIAKSPIDPTVMVPLVLGVGADQHELVVVDLEPGQPGVFVGGPAGSGRTTALTTMATLLVGQGLRIAVVDPRRSGLGDVAGAALRLQGPSATTVDAAALAEAEIQVVLIDDADLLDGQATSHIELASGAAGIPLVAAFTRDTITGAATGWVGQLRRNRSGLLLHPQSRYDAAVFGATTLDDSMIFTGPPGRGVVGLSGRLGVVQVPTP